MQKFKEILSINLFLISLLVLYQTTNQVIALAFVIAITSAYVFKHYQLKIYAEKYLKTQVEILDKLFNSSQDVIIYLDRKNKVVSCNDISAKVLGCEKKEMIGSDFSLVFKNSFSDKVRAENIWTKLESHIHQALSTQQPVQFNEIFDIPDHGFACYSILICLTHNEKSEVNGVILVTRDVTTEYLATKMAQEKEKQLQCLLENMPICAYMKDREGRFITGSSSFVRLLNLHDNQMNQLVISDVFDKEYLDFIAKEEDEIYTTKQPLVVERQINLPKESFFARVRKAPVIDSEGNVEYLVVLYENIEMERELERQKEYFIETLIHDLKVPTLAQLRGLELLQKDMFGETNDDQKDLIQQIVDSCNYILEMISKVLETYRFENGQKSLCFEVFSLADVLLECFNKVSTSAQEKNIQFVYASTQDDTMVEADKDEIAKVITNLLTNALSYTERNEKIMVNISSENNQMRFTMQSRGISLSERECSTMFEKFELNTTRFNTVGSGIGLYLCKKIIDFHSGSIYASTDSNHTNTFTFVIPQYRHELNVSTNSPLYI